VLGADTKRLSECFRAVERLELLERLKRLEQASLARALIRSSNGIFFPTIPDASTFPIGRFERLEQSAAIERLKPAAVIGERPNRALDLLFTGQPQFAEIAWVRFECQK
jgi:hypothetical protein